VSEYSAIAIRVSSNTWNRARSYCWRKYFWQLAWAPWVRGHPALQGLHGAVVTPLVSIESSISH